MTETQEIIFNLKSKAKKQIADLNDLERQIAELRSMMLNDSAALKDIITELESINEN